MLLRWRRSGLLVAAVRCMCTLLLRLRRLALLLRPLLLRPGPLRLLLLLLLLKLLPPLLLGLLLLPPRLLLRLLLRLQLLTLLLVLLLPRWLLLLLTLLLVLPLHLWPLVLRQRVLKLLRLGLLLRWELLLRRRRRLQLLLLPCLKLVVLSRRVIVARHAFFTTIPCNGIVIVEGVLEAAVVITPVWVFGVRTMHRGECDVGPATAPPLMHSL